ncbi:conserved hypothetical protein [Histoplasma capsulatum H143]|uniref:Thioesterase domain-containing protein n=1 Tax=Ajellomyces capsulatus (strain H143) TaxID=544712 RepID=C6HMP2_AJECH|nr:conserved hypothetical protein [Histoplasma capsulatum H143]
MLKEKHTYTTYDEFINNAPVSEDDINFFSAIPCAKPFLNNPSTYRVIPFLPRFDRGEEDTTDRFFTETLASGSRHGSWRRSATLLDETLSNCVEAFRQDMPVNGGESRPRLYTARLQLSFRSPVETPGVIIVKAWLKRVEGRKWFLEGQVVGEDGTVRAEAQSLWVMEKATRGKQAALL